MTAAPCPPILPRYNTAHKEIPDKLYEGPVSSKWHTTTQCPPSAIKLDMDLDVPIFGIVFMNPPEAARVVADQLGNEPEYEVLLNGHLRINLPAGHARIRYESITIGFKVVSRIMEGKEIVEDELYKVETHIQGGYLERSKSYDFVFPIPSTTAPRDWHSKAVVFNYLYAEIHGSPLASSVETSTPTSPPLLARLNPFSSPKARSQPLLPPAYEAPGDVFTGTHRAFRIIRLIYNPNSLGDINSLNEHAKGSSPHLGSYDIRVFSDIWTLSCPVRANLALLDIPQNTTIYSFCVSLFQTHTIRSPRPNSTTITTTHRATMSEGKTPDKVREFPDAGHPALWRGKGAGGKDDGALILELYDRVSHYDKKIRPSTLPTVITPIQVSHVLDMDIYFSVVGIGANGEKLRYGAGGAGGLQVMRIRRKVMLPSCCILPKNVDLPLYGATPETVHLGADPTHPWGQCACALSLEEITARMAAASEAEEASAREAKEVEEAKAVAEGRAV